MKALRKLTVVQFKLYLREPMAFFFTLIFPAALLLLFGAIFGNTPDPQYHPDYGYIDYETPALLALIIATVGLMSVPVATAAAREAKVLRRYRVTPLRARTYILADVLTSLAVAVLGSILLVILGVLVFDLHLPQEPLGVAGAFLLASLAFAALGYLVAGIAPTARVAQVVGMVLFFPMMFLSGAATPVEFMPGWLRTVAEWLPMRHAVRSLQGFWFGESWREFDVQTLALALVLVVAGLLAIRFFRWE
ncbi:MAG: ABC transporter permease [Caldilineae bacterium]|nr:MAG: ABC transporter permease [Caldilineae bacterium]